jgi:hypothetical protein
MELGNSVKVLVMDSINPLINNSLWDSLCDSVRVTVRTTARFSVRSVWNSVSPISGLVNNKSNGTR